MAKTLATRMAFGQEIIEIAKTNENFVVCNADTKTCGLITKTINYKSR